MLRFYLVLMVMIPFELTLTRAFIDCRTACRKCREGFDEVSILEVYCSMCKECRDRRRDRLAQITSVSPEIVRTQTTMPYYKDILDHEIRRVIARGRTRMKPIGRRLNIIDQQMETWPEGCPTPPYCSEEVLHPVKPAIIMSTTTTTMTTTAVSCPPIVTCRPRPTRATMPVQNCCMPACVMPCMPCIPSKVDININWNGGHGEPTPMTTKELAHIIESGNSTSATTTTTELTHITAPATSTNTTSENIQVLMHRYLATLPQEPIQTYPQGLLTHTPLPTPQHELLLHTINNPVVFNAGSPNIQPTGCNQIQNLNGKAYFNGLLDLAGVSLQQTGPCITNIPGGYNIPGGNIPGGNLPGGNIPGVYIPGGHIPGGNMPGGNIPGGNIPGGNIPGVYVPGDHIPGGNIPGGHIPAGHRPDGNIPGLIVESNPPGPNKVQDDYLYLYIGVPKSLGIRKAGPVPTQFRRTPDYINLGRLNYYR